MNTMAKTILGRKAKIELLDYEIEVWKDLKKEYLLKHDCYNVILIDDKIRELEIEKQELLWSIVFKK